MPPKNVADGRPAKGLARIFHQDAELWPVLGEPGRARPPQPIELEAPDPEAALSCLRACAEWPPNYVIYPADDVKQHLSEVLTELLERSVPPDIPRWRIDAGEARKIAGLSIDRGRDA